MIGNLFKDDDEYILKYYKEGVENANKKGFKYIVGFKDTNKEYSSKQLFPVFLSRIPPKNRHDLDEILKKLELEKHDEIEKNTKNIE